MKARTRLRGLASEALPAPSARCAPNPCAACPPRSRRPSARLCGSSSCDVAAALSRYRHAKPSRDRAASADARYAPALIHEAAESCGVCLLGLGMHECSLVLPSSSCPCVTEYKSTARLGKADSPQAHKRRTDASQSVPADRKFGPPRSSGICALQAPCAVWSVAGAAHLRTCVRRQHVNRA